MLDQTKNTQESIGYLWSIAHCTEFSKGEAPSRQELNYINDDASSDYICDLFRQSFEWRGPLKLIKLGRIIWM